MKFLIVDDSPAMQTIIRRSLEKAGYADIEFKLASDGSEALDIIRTWEPELVITDWHMPQMNGLDLMHECNRQMLGIRFGLVTTETSPERIQEARDAGALFVLHKPFEMDEFQRALVPIVQGSVEGEELLSRQQHDQTTYDLHLPALSALTTVINGVCHNPIVLEPTDMRSIDYRHLPYVVSLFCDHGHANVKAVCILDLRAAAVLGCSYEGAAEAVMQQCLREQLLDRHLLDNVKRLMKLTGALFYDPANKQDLDLKGVHLIPKPFERLEKLGASTGDKRLDLRVGSIEYGEGQMILMEVVD